EGRILGEGTFARGQAAEGKPLVRVAQGQLELAPAAPVARPLGLGREPQPHLPEQLPARKAEPVAPAHPDEGLDRRAFQRGGGTPHEVADAAVWTVLLPLGHSGGRRLLAPVAYEAEPNAERAVLDGTPDVAPVHVGQPDRDVVALRVAAQRVERVEP